MAINVWESDVSTMTVAACSCCRDGIEILLSSGSLLYRAVVADAVATAIIYSWEVGQNLHETGIYGFDTCSVNSDAKTLLWIDDKKWLVLRHPFVCPTIIF